jgi:hypothetical protein
MGMGKRSEIFRHGGKDPAVGMEKRPEKFRHGRKKEGEMYIQP